MRFEFTSHDSGNDYTLTSENGRFTCSCPDFTYRGSERPCKHINEFNRTYRMVDEPVTREHELATVVQALRHEAFNAPTRTRTAINQVVSFLGAELADEILSR